MQNKTLFGISFYSPAPENNIAHMILK